MLKKILIFLIIFSSVIGVVGIASAATFTNFSYNATETGLHFYFDESMKLYDFYYDNDLVLYTIDNEFFYPKFGRRHRLQFCYL